MPSLLMTRQELSSSLATRKLVGSVTFRFAETPRLVSHNRLAWYVRNDERWSKLQYEAWPPCDNWKGLSSEERAALWQEFYGSDWPDFESDKQIYPENGEVIDLYNRITDNLSDRRTVEGYLTGDHFSVPDVREIPWTIQEMIKIISMVAGYKRMDVPEARPGDQKSYDVRANAESKKEERWQGIISYCNGLDRYFRGKEI